LGQGSTGVGSKYAIDVKTSAGVLTFAGLARTCNTLSLSDSGH
jgi:hypothetical protein